MGLELDVKYDREELLSELRRLAVKLGRSPRAEDIVKEPGFPSCPVFQRHFGGLAAAREAAGLGEPERKVKWTAEVIDRALLRAAKELKRAPTERDLYRLTYLPNPQTVCRVAGSLAAVLDRLGLKRGKKWHPNDEYSDDELIDHLREVAKRIGDSPTMRDLQEADGKYSDKLYVRRFGSWNEALRAARLSLHRQEVPSRDVLCRKLIELERRLGRPPKLKDLEQHLDMPPATAYRKQFKSWREALTSAGIGTDHLPMQFELFDDDLMLAALLELARRLGRTPDIRVAAHLNGFPSPSVFAERFGSWNNALEAAGLPANRKKYRACDGHICDSKQERMVDDFLSANHVAHTIHPLYPKHATYNPRADRCADWRLDGGTLVEFFGVVGKAWYDRKRRMKVDLARATRIRLVQVIPEDLRHERLHAIFSRWIDGR